MGCRPHCLHSTSSRRRQGRHVSLQYTLYMLAPEPHHGGNKLHAGQNKKLWPIESNRAVLLTGYVPQVLATETGALLFALATNFQAPHAERRSMAARNTNSLLTGLFAPQPQRRTFISGVRACSSRSIHVGGRPAVVRWCCRCCRSSRVSAPKAN